jgi:hypothetical protein
MLSLLRGAGDMPAMEGSMETGVAPVNEYFGTPEFPQKE